MKINKIMTGIIAAILMTIPVTSVYASDGDEYITITVQASDDNEGITYALDDDDPGSFGPSNMFTIPAGTSHIIYVKDAAGNITSQIYEPPESEQPGIKATDDHESDSGSYESDSTDYTYSSSYSDNTSDEYDGQTINIDLELKKSESESERPYEIRKGTPAEQGEGTVYSKTFLDGTDSSEQVFYSMTTAEGDVFYLLIDQGQENNNVYLLNQVNNQDLAALAVDGGNVSQTKDREEDSLLKALSTGSSSGSEGNSTDNSKTAAKGGINKNTIILLLLMAVGGGFYYYQKVYKAKKEQEMDAMEAPDMDQFSTSGSEDEEEFDFEYDNGDKEQYLMELIQEDEEEYAAAAESEAVNTGWEEDLNSGEEVSGISDDIFSDDELNGKFDPELDDEEDE